ncbi:MAG: nucleotidyltransferase family protein [Armatimonadetes bacterium]|nr:nucleotidyltransferase family protein [Armatimonadota bacterium]
MGSPKANVRIPVPSASLESFCQRWGVAELSLFGSVLRDDFSPESDIDILVAWKPGVRIGMIGLARMTTELEEIFARRVDLVPKQGLKPVLRDQVLHEAKTIYGAA